MSDGRHNILGREAAALLLCAAAAGCRPQTAAAPPPESRTEEVARGPVRVAMTVTPAAPRYDRDVLLTLEVTAPAGMAVTLPPLDDRVQGFALTGFFSDDPVERGGNTVQAHHARLTPRIAPEHRIAPIPVTFPGGWLATRPMALRVVPPVDGNAPDDISADPRPVWIRPSPRAILAGCLAAAAAAGLAFLAWKAARRLRRRVLDMRLSPRERALRELEQLLARRLVARGLVKDFYVELTMVVRRYIERAHAVRAPEQTTEEFLASAATSPRFDARVLATLRAFLQAADLVKFAADRPADEAVDRAVSTARAYIQTDADQPPARPAEEGG